MIYASSIPLFHCMEIPRLIRENNAIVTLGGLVGLKIGFDEASTNTKKKRRMNDYCDKCCSFAAVSAQLLLLMHGTNEFTGNGIQETSLAHICGFLAGYGVGYATAKMKDKFSGKPPRNESRRSRGIESLSSRPEKTSDINADVPKSYLSQSPESSILTNQEINELFVQGLMDRDDLRARFQDPWRAPNSTFNHFILLCSERNRRQS